MAAAPAPEIVTPPSVARSLKDQKSARTMIVPQTPMTQKNLTNPFCTPAPRQTPKFPPPGPPKKGIRFPRVPRTHMQDPEQRTPESRQRAFIADLEKVAQELDEVKNKDQL